jgi:Na+-transporting methylmalonyl-CoA/oxaloacetate decarboxylase gamma subunit
LTITIVGMLTVFAFLIVLVVSMSLLRRVAGRLPGVEEPGALDTRTVAAIVAAVRHREPGSRER